MNDTSKDQGLTALHIIVRGETDNERLVSTLLNHPRINVNVQDGEKWTALHHLCQRGFPGAVLSLQTADFCCLNQEGDSPLHLAAANLHSNIFSRLAECESFKTRYRNNPCFTELKVITKFTKCYAISLCRMPRETHFCIWLLILLTCMLLNGALNLDSKSIPATFTK